VDLEEFLTENGIPVDQQQQHQQQQHNGHPPSNNNNGSVNSGSGGSSNNSSSSNGMTPGDQVSGEECSPSPRANGGHLAQQLPQQQQPPHHVGQYGPGPSVRNNQGHNNHNDHIIHHSSLSNPQNLLRGPPSIHTQSESVSRSPSPCGSDISSHSDDSNSSLPPGHHHEGMYLFIKHLIK